MKTMMLPRPGRPVRGSATGRPIMALLDLLGRKAALRIIWELKDEPLSFRALAAAAETNPGVLNARLHELKAADIVTLTPDGYALTAEGKKLLTELLPLSRWADRWAARTKSG